jgi:hypothetical protein
MTLSDMNQADRWSWTLVIGQLTDDVTDRLHFLESPDWECGLQDTTAQVAWRSYNASLTKLTTAIGLI